MTEENYWYSPLEPPLEAVAVAEAKIIVDAFRDRRPIPIEIGGFRDDAKKTTTCTPVALPSCTPRVKFSPANSTSAKREEPRSPRSLRSPRSPRIV